MSLHQTRMTNELTPPTPRTPSEARKIVAASLAAVIDELHALEVKSLNATVVTRDGSATYSVNVRKRGEG